ncbi:MAG: aminoacyl-tRNA hydrolase, partial [Anaerolineae bacterium]|nr:aminoacyl-tRNA hydrolase [Anaerolineae bacterium]
EFPRLRIGIGRPARGDPVDYVLSDFTLDESIVMDRALDRAVEAIVAWLKLGIEAAMNAYNRPPPALPGE